MNPKYEKLDTETDYEYGLRLISIKIEEKPDDLEWEDIVEFLKLDCHRDSLRKAAAVTQYSGYSVMQYFKEKIGKDNSSNKDDYISELEKKKRELEREKVKFYDERKMWQKQNYADARVEQKLDYLEKRLCEQGRILFEVHEHPEIKTENDLLIQLSDLHIGQAFNSIFGNYNSDIAKTRLEKYLEEILKIKNIHNCQKAIVLLQGDLISGSIHKSVQVTNRENVIEQIKVASETISSFMYELTKNFTFVHFYNVSGNHSRIDKKDDALHDERLDDLISWSVSNTLSHIENFVPMNHRSFDTGIVDIAIRGKSYIGVHGDYDQFSDSGVSKLCMFLGFVPEAILFGHKHQCKYSETQGVKMIMSGSLAGSGDQYTIEKRLSGKPSQMATVCNSDGIVCCYPVMLG